MKYDVLVVGAGPAGLSAAIRIKMVWRVPEAQHAPGTVVHTVGYPAAHSHYGGGFIYHMRVALGLVLGLDYDNPNINTFQEFQRWKSHPSVRKHIEGGECLQYGARALNEGGLQSIPKLSFPGGALIGCSAGFVNVPKIKGTHTAMMSGMMAGEAAFRGLTADKAPAQAHKRVGSKASRPDHEHLTPLASAPPAPVYPKPDGAVTFDLPTSLYRSGTNHEHDQPSHLLLRDPGAFERSNLPHYGGPETKYCPAGVYEYRTDEASGRTRLHVNAQNCLHCKACDIKDPGRNIRWTVPEGGQGPGYTAM
ncbi:Electron transfer flavoprotein-ubiquinone oxidoreductase, mitochondrial [Tetrabaena socialis]|uniref:Electron transfer flavoprotein-ubiquinone oxidoreductase n=1 Tax=Tetrabaena socialis TaxID=47790 RepID=A0A2J8AIA1_9CHLO|nr:Electron transfer flavoprotein-ubiquinone oxidoreductase, mitochondrial [Tetrabaena socialis]|eukprot:PNH12244.1 Electron transfer flavoprotein-ubiquinone oxidoreductase, mitochondrial [Tetrabaena socialis]